MDLIDRKALLKELSVHPEGGLRSIKEEFLMLEVREEIRNAPTIPAVPLDKLCEWLAVCTDDPPCISLRGYDCDKVCREKKPSDAECWETVITKWMEGLDAAD